jgi:hypothetical protein
MFLLRPGSRFLRQRAFRGHVASPGGAEPPAAPTGLGATVGDQQLTLAWDPVAGATAYHLYHGASAGVTKETGTKIADVTSPYVHSSLGFAQTRYYVVTAEGEGGESEDSAEASATTIPLLPVTAAHLAAIGCPAPSMGLRLDAPSGDLTDFIAGKTFTAANSPTYGVDSSDFAGHESIATAYATGQAFTCSDTAFLDSDASTTVTWLFLGRVGNEGGGGSTTFQRTLLGKADAGSTGHRLWIRHSDGHVAYMVNESAAVSQTITVAVDHEDSLLLAVGAADRTAGKIRVATHLGQNEATLTRTGTYVTATGASWSTSVAGRCPQINEGLYALAWVGTTGMTVAEMRDFWKTRLQAAGAFA